MAPFFFYSFKCVDTVLSAARLLGDGRPCALATAHSLFCHRLAGEELGLRPGECYVLIGKYLLLTIINEASVGARPDSPVVLGIPFPWCSDQIEFVRGKPPVLTIYDKDSGELEETINLQKFNIGEVRGGVGWDSAGDVPSLCPSALMRNEANGKRRKVVENLISFCTLVFLLRLWYTQGWVPFRRVFVCRC